nr:MAG TPA: hypothetical protein [Siphoviridae sp. ctngg6]
MEFNRTYMGIHDMWKDLGWRIEKEFEPDVENANVLIWYAWRVFGEGLQKVVIIGNKVKNESENTYNSNSSVNNENEIEKIETEIAEVPDSSNSEADVDTIMEVSHEEKSESEFTLEVNTAIYAGSQIKDMYEGTSISFIDYHYLYLIGDTAREMERQLDKMEYVKMPDQPDETNVTESESISSTITDTPIVFETNDSDKTIIDGIEVSKEEEQSLLGGEF